MKDRARKNAAYAENPEKFRALKRQQRAADPEAARLKARLARLARLDACHVRDRASDKARRAKDPARARERARLKRSVTSPIARSICGARYRARRAGAEGRYTARQWRVLCEAWEWTCLYCGAPVSERTAVREHRVPLLRGGSNDISNIAVSCAPCNFRKGTMTDREFLARRVA